MSLTLERIKDMPRIKQEIIHYLFEQIARKPVDQWIKYKGEFAYEGVGYLLEADVRYDNTMFTYRNLIIEHKQVVLDVEDVLAGNILNGAMRQ